MRVFPKRLERAASRSPAREGLIWTAGARLSLPLSSGERHHWLSARVGWHRSVMSVAYNAEFNGLSANALDIHPTGQLTLVNQRSWLELGGNATTQCGVHTTRVNE